MKTISIVTPMYNSFPLLQRNLEVLSKQRECKIELVLVDDCSTDDSFFKAQEYAKTATFDVKVIQNEKNGGPGCSRNHGLQYVTGDYVTFADSDDYFSEDFTERLAPLLEAAWDCIIFDYSNVDEQGNFISDGKSVRFRNAKEGEIDPREAMVYVVGTPWGKMYKREILLNNNVLFAPLFRNEDMPFTKWAVSLSKNVYYCSQSLYRYVQVSTSLMHNDRLLDERNCQCAIVFLKENVCAEELKEELLAIELREVLNNTVLIKLAKKATRKELIEYIKTNYTKQHLKNKYFKQLPRYIKIISYCAYYRLIFALTCIWKYKKWKQRKN